MGVSPVLGWIFIVVVVIVVVVVGGVMSSKQRVFLGSDLDTGICLHCTHGTASHRKILELHISRRRTPWRCWLLAGLVIVYEEIARRGMERKAKEGRRRRK